MPFLESAGLGVLAAAGQSVAGNIGTKRQYKYGKKIAEFQNQLNKEYLDYYNQYNTPKAQMARFQEAGLNPHLIYGQGSSGNQSSPQQAADIPVPDFGFMSGIIPLINQTAMTRSQVNATDAKTDQAYAVTALKRLEKQVLERNPLLNDATWLAISDGILATAELKRGEQRLQGVELEFQQATVALRAAKIEREIELLEQRFELGTLDKSIKAEVLKSKDFQNAILEVQKKFLADAEIGPAQILQFFQLLLMKIL